MTEYYSNYKLNICRDKFNRCASNGTYPSNDNGLTVVETEPSYERWRALVDRVGEPWGWNKRPVYHESNRVWLLQKLRSEGSRLFLLQKDQKTIGFCWAYAANLKATFGFEDGDTPGAKIETYGLFEEETGKGHGRFFLPMIFRELFNAGAENVFLESRSTNHPGVIPFYERMGMSVIDVDHDLEDDLIDDRAFRQS
ncbi:MAG: GNAT family N-acetyltransferase [Alphaproteobacteria bacterium]|nr:GNAT family N-acetyltransferase [Alphaproteobacteria bacterium]